MPAAVGAHAPNDDERVLLVSMPFGALERPSLALGLLQAHCDRMGVSCATRYLTVPYAERVGREEYLWAMGDVPYTAFVGEWLFAQALYGPRPDADTAYVEEVLQDTWRLELGDVARLWRMRAQVEPFLAHCMGAVAWGEHTLVGFTSTFQQNLPSLALAARVKATHPDVTVAFGGANWEEAMGVALLRCFPFVDLAFSGEADQTFPAVLRARRAGRDPAGIRGVTARGTPDAAAGAPAARVERLDDVPAPDYDAFFEQVRRSPIAAGLPTTLLIETARGCWWGERSHCTFCGLNGATMAFRSKSPERVVAEIAGLRERYGVRAFNVVDDILDMRYFDTVLPLLAEAQLDAGFFWEVKANLTRRHVRQLRDAGVHAIQPGIESLSDHVLKLMRKGVSGFRNIELLKWCREYGVKCYWNLLYGFPGETAADYAESVALLRAIWHLEPPTAYGPIRMDRFSPYHADPAAFGMRNVRPMAPFVHLYPFEPATVMELAYYFEFDYDDGRTEDAYATEAVELARSWMADPQPGALEQRRAPDGSLVVLDTRSTTTGDRTPRRAVLRDWKAAVFTACDRACTLDKFLALAPVREAGVGEDDVRAFLARCVEHRLMVANERRWLNLAVHVPAREREAADADAAAPTPPTSAHPPQAVAG